MVVTTLDESIRQLHAEGQSDATIGRALAVPRQTVRDRRRAMGLAMIGRPRSPVFDASNGRIRELYAEGLSDRQIGARLGCSREVIFTRRARLGLPSRHRTNARNQHDLDPTDYAEIDRLALAWRLVVAGQTDADVAAACGVTPEQARDYRERMPKWWRRECGVREAFDRLASLVGPAVVVPRKEYARLRPKRRAG